MIFIGAAAAETEQEAGRQSVQCKRKPINQPSTSARVYEKNARASERVLWLWFRNECDKSKVIANRERTNPFLFVIVYLFDLS